MRQALLTVMTALLVAAGAGVQAQDHGGAADAAKLEKALRTAFVLAFAEDLQLDEQQTLSLVRTFTQEHVAIGKLRARQSELRGAVMSGGANVQSDLSALIQVDRDLVAAQSKAAQQAGADLAPGQRAQLYVLLSTLDAHVEAILGAGHKAATDHSCMHPAQAAAEAAPLDPQEQVLQVILNWAEGVKAQDIDLMMTAFSDNFEHYEYGDTTGVRNFLQQATDMGYLEGSEVATQDTEIEIKGDKATAHPVQLIGVFGQATIEFSLRKEDSGWRIVGMAVSGV